MSDSRDPNRLANLDVHLYECREREGFYHALAKGAGVEVDTRRDFPQGGNRYVTSERAIEMLADVVERAALRKSRA